MNLDDFFRSGGHYLLRLRYVPMEQHHEHRSYDCVEVEVVVH